MKTKYKVKMAEGDERIFDSERLSIESSGVLIFKDEWGKFTWVINKDEWKEIEVER